MTKVFIYSFKQQNVLQMLANMRVPTNSIHNVFFRLGQCLLKTMKKHFLNIIRSVTVKGFETDPFGHYARLLSSPW